MERGSQQEQTHGTTRGEERHSSDGDSGSSTSSYARSVGRNLGFDAASAALSPSQNALYPVQCKGGDGDLEVAVPSSGGAPLPHAIQRKMGDSFGADFSGVRVHEGPSADSMGGVRAATQGSNITFAAGEYSPGSQAGQELIGHELTHVVHQAAGRVQPTAQAKGGMINTDPGLEAEADRMGALAAAGKPAPVAGAAALGPHGVSGGVAQFNLLKDAKKAITKRVEKRKEKKRNKKQARTDAKNANRTAIDTARDAADGAEEVADSAVTTLAGKLATYVDGQLGSKTKLVEQLKEHGAEHVKNHIGGGDLKNDDAAAFAAEITKASRAHYDAIEAKAQALAEPVATGAKADLVSAAEAGYDATSGAGDATALVEKAKRAAIDKAAAKAAKAAAAGKVALDEQLKAQKSAILADLKVRTGAGVEGAADAELTSRTNKDAQVAQVVDPAVTSGVNDLGKEVTAWLEDKLGVEGVGETRSAKLKVFRARMKAAGKAKAREDARTKTAGESDELTHDAEKRASKAAGASVKAALKELAVEGKTHSLGAVDADTPLRAAASKAAWGSIRDGGRGKSAAKQAVAEAKPAVLADVIKEARDWKNEYVKGAKIGDAETAVTAKVSGDDVGKDAGDESLGVKGDVDAIVASAVPPAEKLVKKQVEEYLVTAVGAQGAAWWRSTDLRAFRAKMKKAGRAQAYHDVDEDLQNNHAELRDGGRAYMGIAGRDVAYDKAKGSVNAQMEDLAKAGALEVLANAATAQDLEKAARKAAFAGFRHKKPKREVKALTRSAAKGAVATEAAKALAEAKTWKAGLFANTANAETAVQNKVKNDNVGERSVKTAIKANTTAEGMSALGRLADLVVKNRGDSAKLEVELKIPVPETPAYVSIKVVAEAERGVTTRKNGAPPGGVDAKSLKVGAQLNVGGGVELWGLQLDGSLGFFVRAQAMDTQKTFQALNYAAYRVACGINDGMANWWGGSGKSKGDGSGTDGGHGKGAMERAEMWAAMVEENVFMKENPKYVPGSTDPKKKHKFIPDEDAFVDIGGALNAKGKLKAHVFEAEAALRAELFSHIDGEVIKKRLAKAKLDGKVTNNDVALGNAGGSRQDAKERRRAIRGKAGGGIVIEAKAQFKILEQLCEFAGKLEAGSGGWGIELAAGLKLDTAGGPTAFESIANGIVGGAASAVRSIAGIYQNTQQTGGEQGNKIAGSVLDVGSDVEGIIDAGTGGQLTTALGAAYQVDAGKSDQVNETASNMFDDVTKTDNEVPDNEATKDGTSSEVMLQVVISIGPDAFNLQIKHVKVRKVGVSIGTVGLDGQIEQQKRLAQIGIVGGKFHAEGLGFGTSRRDTARP